MDILEHLGMLVPDIEGHGVITGRASVVAVVEAIAWTIVVVERDYTVRKQNGVSREDQDHVRGPR